MAPDVRQVMKMQRQAPGPAQCSVHTSLKLFSHLRPIASGNTVIRKIILFFMIDFQYKAFLSPADQFRLCGIFSKLATNESKTCIVQTAVHSLRAAAATHLPLCKKVIRLTHLRQRSNQSAPAGASLKLHRLPSGVLIAGTGHDIRP
jgi:hypothetical protein